MNAREASPWRSLQKTTGLRGTDGVKGAGPGEATCRGERLLARQKLFVSGHWQRRGAAGSRLAGA